MPNIIKRLDRLKALMPTPLIVICKLPTGEEVNLTVDECVSAGLYPVRTIGNNLADAHRLLDYMAGPDCAID